ncbi:response regulator [Enterovirga sp. GCM10030262]|uniref:response regulator n=1 Tax=Enterovirga sp. GCM10030262 TaxID=3273391 RepID=UPI00360F489A
MIDAVSPAMAMHPNKEGMTTAFAGAADAARSDAGRGPGVAPGRRIAIVEDELMVAWSLESMAEDLGHYVVGIYASGEAALAGIGDMPPDLVLMDINLGGGIDGIETARRLRHGSSVAILFISAYADRETRDRALDAVPGAMLLGKPVPTVALAKAIVAATSPLD